MEEQSNKVERLALELNKSGLSFLSACTYYKSLEHGNNQAFDYFKKAEKILIAQIKADPDDQKIQGLLAVNFNNLAIYYKRTNKPKAALTYLKQALEIEVFKINDSLASASTHLNICAIYSFMGKHLEAVEHANLSIEMADKAKSGVEKNNEDSALNKSCENIKLASTYNLAIEYEHLKRLDDALDAYKKAKEYAKLQENKNLESNCQDSIHRLEKEIISNRKKLLEMLQKKKDNEEKGNYDSMRKNKKNYKPLNLTKVVEHNKPTNEKVEAKEKKRTLSVGKILPLHPIRSSCMQIFKGSNKNTEQKENNKEILIKSSFASQRKEEKEECKNN